MADTRTIYLVTDTGKIFTSDKLETAYTYLLMTDFSNLNPTDTTTYSDDVIIYGDYEAKIMLTFDDRTDRAEWVSKYQNSISQISVAVDTNKNLIYNKKATIKSVDFIENPYINGVQLELTLSLSGKWNTSILPLDSEIGVLVGGTKTYAQNDVCNYGYTYDYRYGYQPISDDFDFSGFNSFIISIAPNSLPVNLTIKSKGGTVTLRNTTTNVPLQISSDMAGYEIDDFNKFTMLSSGFSATQYWDNFLSVYGTLKKVLAYDKLTVVSTDSNSAPVLLSFYEYNSSDFI